MKALGQGSFHSWGLFSFVCGMLDHVQSYRDEDDENGDDVEGGSSFEPGCSCPGRVPGGPKQCQAS